MVCADYLVRDAAATDSRSATEKAFQGEIGHGSRQPRGGVDFPTLEVAACLDRERSENAARRVGRSDAYRAYRGLPDASPTGMGHSIELRACHRRHWGLMMWLCAASSALLQSTIGW